MERELQLRHEVSKFLQIRKLGRFVCKFMLRNARFQYLCRVTEAITSVG